MVTKKYYDFNNVFSLYRICLGLKLFILLFLCRCRNIDVVFRFDMNESKGNDDLTVVKNQTLEKESIILENKNISMKRKNEFEDIGNSKKMREVKEIIFKNIEKNELKFNKILNIQLNTDNRKVLSVCEYTYNDFLTFINFIESFYLPLENISLRDFFLIISVFEYLEIEFNSHLEKIIFILIYKLFSILECDKKELKTEIFEIKKQFILPLRFSEIIIRQIKKIFFPENLYEEYFVEYNLFPLLKTEYTIEYLDNNSIFYTHSDIETCLSDTIYQDSTLFFNIHYVFFEIFGITKYVFSSQTADFFVVNRSINRFIDNIYEIIIFNLHITDVLLKLLENIVFENLKCIYILNSTIETTNKSFLKKFNNLQKINVICNYFDEENEDNPINGSDACAIIEVKNYIFVSDFEEKILRLINLENSVSSQNGKYFIIEKDTVLNEIEDLFFFKENIVDLHISFKKEINFSIFKFVESLENLKTVKVDYISLQIENNSPHDLFSLKKIHELKIEEHKIDEQMMCEILTLSNIRKLTLIVCEIEISSDIYFIQENNTILEVSFFSEENCNLISLVLLLKSLKNLEILYLDGYYIYKILYLENFSQFIANKTFKILSIISKYSDESFQSFEFDTDITEDLFLSNNNPSGNLKNIFRKNKMTKLKNLSLHGFYIGKDDRKVLENLEKLISLDLVNCYFEENSFSGLFSEEKKFIIENLILKLVKITKEDIIFISKLQRLKNLTLFFCEFTDECYRNFKAIYFEKLEHFSFSRIDTLVSSDQINYFTQEFSPNIFSYIVKESFL